MKPRFYGRELSLLILPVLLLGFLAIYFKRRPQPVTKPAGQWHLATSIARRAVTPCDVRGGVDTIVRLNMALVAPDGQVGVARANAGGIRSGCMWNDIRLVERDEQGRARRLWSVVSYLRGEESPEIERLRRRFRFGGAVGGTAESHSMAYSFPLRKLGRPENSLEMRIDSVWRPLAGGDIRDATPGEVARMRTMPDALSSSSRLVLRRRGEKTPTPVVSTDPMFDVRHVEVRRVKSNSSPAGMLIQMRWRVFWKGALSGTHNQPSFVCRKSVTLMDEQGHPLSFNDNSLARDVDSMARNVRTFSVWDEWTGDEIGWYRQRMKELKSKKLFLRGWISIGGAWPKRVDVVVPDWVWKPDKTKS